MAESLPAGSESVGQLLTDCAQGWAVHNNDEEMGLSRRRPVGGLRLRGAYTMAHLLSCRLLDEACTADGMATVTERAKACARNWENIV